MENTERNNLSSDFKMEIQAELSQCREDERAAKNHIFQVFAVAVGILAIIFSTSPNNPDPRLEFIMTAIPIVMMCAAFSYVLTVGILTMVRHHYSKDLENMLKDSNVQNDKPQFFHWVQVSAPLISLNRKRTQSTFNRIYSIAYVVSFLFVFMLGALFIWAQIDIKELLSSLAFSDIKFENNISEEQFNTITLIIVLFFFVYVLGFIYMINFTTQNSEKFYSFAMKEAEKRAQVETHTGNATKSGPEASFPEEPRVPKPNSNNKPSGNLAKAALYYVYPRPNDVQKSLFIALGGLLGLSAFSLLADLSLYSATDILLLIVKVMIVLDFCTYQARYQWNDLRGLGEDREHPISNKRNRLPISTIQPLFAIHLSIATLSLRIFIALALATRFHEMAVSLHYSIALIFILALFYEWARTKNSPKWILFFVSLGYPLRIFSGIWAVWSSISQSSIPLHMMDLSVVYVIFAFIILSSLFFGRVFVSLTWVHEAVFLKQNAQSVKKMHLEYLRGQLHNPDMHSKYPLRERGNVWTTWNNSHIISMLLIVVAMIVASGFSIHIVLCSLVLLVFTVVSCLIGESRIILLFPSLLVSLVEIYFCLSLKNILFSELGILITIIQAIYISIYLFFRHTNYEELYQGLIETFKGIWGMICAFILGKPTCEYIMLLRRDNPKKRQ